MYLQSATWQHSLLDMTCMQYPSACEVSLSLSSACEGLKELFSWTFCCSVHSYLMRCQCKTNCANMQSLVAYMHMQVRQNDWCLWFRRWVLHAHMRSGFEKYLA